MVPPGEQLRLDFLRYVKIVSSSSKKFKGFYRCVEKYENGMSVWTWVYDSGYQRIEVRENKKRKALFKLGKEISF